MKPWNRCSDCGKFVPYDDFGDGSATVSIDRSADIHGAISESEVVECRKCITKNAPDKEQGEHFARIAESRMTPLFSMAWSSGS